MNDDEMKLAKMYSDGERAARQKITVVWDALRHALAEDAVFSQRIASGDLAEMAEYHTGNVKKLGGYDVQLRQLMTGALTLIEAMQAASVQAGENLFPGVQVAAKE